MCVLSAVLLELSSLLSYIVIDGVSSVTYGALTCVELTAVVVAQSVLAKARPITIHHFIAAAVTSTGLVIYSSFKASPPAPPTPSRKKLK